MPAKNQEVSNLQSGSPRAGRRTGPSLVPIMILLLTVGLASAAHAAVAGDLDRTFDQDGTVYTSFSAGNGGNANDLVIQPNGKILAVGGYDMYLGFSPNGTEGFFELARYNPDGSLDTSFSGDGKLLTNVEPGVNEYASAVALQADGKIVVAGVVGNSDNYPNSDFAVVRYNPNGTLDQTFSGDGILVSSFAPDHESFVEDVAIQADGKVVLAGTSAPYDEFGFPDWRYALARFTPGGSPDTGFDGDGTLLANFSPDPDGANAVSLQPDGKIVVGGRSGYNYSSDFVLTRHHPNGALDASFDGDGRLATNVGNDSNGPQELAVLGDGRIVSAGTSLRNSSRFCFALTRHNADGSLDASFDGDGKVSTTFPGDALAEDLAIQNDGKIVVAGTSYPDTGSRRQSRFLLARYRLSGGLDTTFSGDGFQTTFSDSYNEGRAVAIQGDGRIVAAGWTSFGFGLARYLDVTPPDTTKPRVVSVSPNGNRVSPKANLTSTFSEAMDPSTIGRATFKLVRKGTTASVPARVTYSGATDRATLNPSKSLKAGATYRATVTTGAKDLAGNRLVKSRAWTFRTRG